MYVKVIWEKRKAVYIEVSPNLAALCTPCFHFAAFFSLSVPRAGLPTHKEVPLVHLNY